MSIMEEALPNIISLYVGHLIHTLQGCALKEQDVQDIISRISTYADEITGDAASGG